MSKDKRHQLSMLTEEEFQAHKKWLEEIRECEPVRSCEKVRAWMKLNIEASMTPVWKN
jgi:hypothetical protein